MSPRIAPTTVGAVYVVLRHAVIETFQSKRFCGLDELKTPPLTISVEPGGAVTVLMFVGTVV